MVNGEHFSFAREIKDYRHLAFSVDGSVGTLMWKVNENEPFKPDYKLKLNSYDLGVDIELADLITRLRFEYPQVNCVLLTSPQGKVFCAGANIFMLRSSDHSFKVNFCKFTNETRIHIEEASKNSGIKFLCAANGVTAGGGYELALACDEILLIDDGNSAVSLPEVPLLGVLPGTGGLTRLTDKRKVRKDRCDVFCTQAEGVKGKRAAEWNLVDAVIPRSEWEEGVKQRAAHIAQSSVPRAKKGINLPSIEPMLKQNGLVYEYVQLTLNHEKRSAELTVQGPSDQGAKNAAELFKNGATNWSLQAFRELDDALLRLRMHYAEIGLVTLRSAGDSSLICLHDENLAAFATDAADGWFAREIQWLQARVLRRLDLTSRTFVALIDEKSAFAGSLAELAWACDRSYLLSKEGQKEGGISLSSANFGAMPMSNHLTRLQAWFWGQPNSYQALQSVPKGQALSAAECERLGLATFVLDDIDFDDEVRMFMGERSSMSPDALTGMEANLRFVGPETMESKIFARLSAWQNWIFTRDNATGPSGALTSYGSNSTAKFNFERC